MTTPPVPLRLALVNDYAVVVAGVEAMLTSSGLDFDLERVAVDALILPADLDVVVFDSFGAIDVAQRVRDLLARTDAAVLIFGASHPPSVLLEGRVRFLHKGATGAELADAITRAAERSPQPVSSPFTVESVGAWPGQHDGLTLRESEVIALLASGLSNADIAEHLFLGVNTVKTYIRTAYGKVGVTSRSTAVLWALRHGFERPG